MLTLFQEGGLLFMSLISLLALTGLILIIRALLQPEKRTKQRLYYIRYVGMLALVCGILGQLIGLYGALQAIVAMGEVPQELLAGGIRVSSITPLYGLCVFLFTHLCWLLLHYSNRQGQKSSKSEIV